MRSLTSLRQLVGSLENQDSWKSRQQLQQLLTCWVQVVGVAVASHTRPIAIQRRVLQVAASSAVWAQNLAFERPRILQKLNDRLALDLKDIRFSTAYWHADSGQYATLSSELDILWQNHPSQVTSLSANPSVNPSVNQIDNRIDKLIDNRIDKLIDNRIDKLSKSGKSGQLGKQIAPIAQTLTIQNPLAAAYPPVPDPQSAFRNWAKIVRSRSQELPLCPRCQCPAPPGELQRWSICSLCAAQQFGSNR